MKKKNDEVDLNELGNEKNLERKLRNIQPLDVWV